MCHAVTAVNDVLYKLKLSVPNRPVFVGVSKIQRFPNRFGPIVHDVHQAFPFNARRYIRRGQSTESGEYIEEISEFVRLLSLGHAGPGEYQRYPNTVIVAVLFAEKTVLTHRQPVVSGKNDYGIFQRPFIMYAG